MRRTTNFILALILLTGLAAGQLPEEIREELELTAEQARKIGQAMVAFKKLSEALYLDIQEQEIMLKREMIKERPDIGRIRPIVEKKNELATRLEVAKIANILEIKSQMSEEQFRLWRQFEETKMVHEDRERLRRDEVRAVRELERVEEERRRQARELVRLKEEFARQRKAEARQRLRLDEERRRQARENARLKDEEAAQKKEKEDEDGDGTPRPLAQGPNGMY